MLSKTALLALAASSFVSAQTFTACDPTKKTCPPDKAVGKNSIKCDFTKGACDDFSELPGTSIKYNDNGAVFAINEAADAPTIATGAFILFGRVDVELQAAPGAGVVTSLVLQSDDLDEIDWEWVGGDNTQAQTNYFSKGDTSTYNRGAMHSVANPTGQFHTYSVEWTSAHVQWLIDNVVVRELAYGPDMPQTPMEIKMGTWVAGREGAPDGTVQWAGGMTDFSKAPIQAFYKSVSIVDYAGADGPTDKSVKQYIYVDKSGTWQSIQVVEGDSSSDDDNNTSSGSSSSSPNHSKTTMTTAAPTKSADSSSSSKSSSSSDSSSSSKSSSSSSSDSSSDSSSSFSIPSNSTAPVRAGSGGLAQPTTIPSNSGSRGTIAVLSVLAAGAGALVAQLLL